MKEDLFISGSHGLECIGIDQEQLIAEYLIGILEWQKNTENWAIC